MATKQSPIDNYISKSAEFAQPILRHLRELVHTAYPEIEETLKWSFPHFMHKGIVCSMAAFKQHCTFGFWKGALFLDGKHASAEEGMGHFGRITSLADLPQDAVIISYVKKAVQLNEEGVKAIRKPKSQGPRELEIPAALKSALQSNKKALATFEQFSYSHKKEYVEWIAEAKREETLDKRLKTTVAWLSEGKPRHWKYANC
jgi:uncharacterized protein YdeI (YjbR/CyaY-like superfamily)